MHDKSQMHLQVYNCFASDIHCTKCSPKRNLDSQKKAPNGLIAQDFMVCPNSLVFCLHFFQTSKGSLMALRQSYFRGSSPLQSIQNNEGCAAAH